MSEDTRVDVIGVDVPSARQVAAHIEALNLAGLAFASKRVLGKDPNPVTGQFTMWSRAGQPGLPALVEPFWTALAPLRIGRPSGPAAAVCNMVLQGRERDAGVAASAAADCARAGKAQFKASPLPDMTGDARPDVLRQRALVNAVKDYWRAAGTVYSEARAVIITGDMAAAVDLLRSRERVLRDLVEQVTVGAAGVAGASPMEEVGRAPQAEPEEFEPADEAPPPQPQPEPEPEPEPEDALPLNPTGLQLTDEQAEAFATHRPLVQPERPEPRPVEVLSKKPVRNHPFLPIVFLLIVSGVALFVLYNVINNPANPLR